jgi:hypothetical protein
MEDASLATTSTVLHRSRGDWKVTEMQERRATGAANGTDIGSGSEWSRRWLGVLFVELAVVVTHSGDLCVPYDWDWHRKMFTL